MKLKMLWEAGWKLSVGRREYVEEYSFLLWRHGQTRKTGLYAKFGGHVEYLSVWVSSLGYISPSDDWGVVCQGV